MTEAILILSMLGVFAVGYIAMGRLDLLLYETRRSIRQEGEKKEPSCLMLMPDLSDEELAREIHRFRSKHRDMRIMLYDNPPQISSAKPYFAGRKK